MPSSLSHQQIIMTAALQIQQVSRRFVKTPGAIEKLASWMGADFSVQTIHAVDQVSFEVNRGEVVGLVGESGCGKSTLGRMIAGLLPLSEGRLLYDGQPLPTGTDLNSRRSRLRLQMIFQDPMSSLNPRMKVGDIIGEAPVLHGLVSAAEKTDYVANLLKKVSLDPDYAKRFAHQFSGGQRQRICIARALAVQPDFLICDESVAALDVSIQAQIINLFQQLRADLGLTYLFISHDLGVVQHVADRVVVMYLGRVVETGPSDDLFSEPLHPYTRALLDEVPRLNSGKRAYVPIKGEIASALNPPAGCHFHTRCPQAGPRCKREQPTTQNIGAQTVACHLHQGGTQ
jgi:oligopeptide/dipeptide ABC transporter ATP-binding protein